MCFGYCVSVVSMFRGFIHILRSMSKMSAIHHLVASFIIVQLSQVPLLTLGDPTGNYNQTMLDKMTAVQAYLDDMSYNVLVPPILDNNSKVRIHVSFEIVKIASVATSVGEMSVLGTIVVDWNDKRLSWSHTKLSDVVCVKRRASTVWFPELLLVNGISNDLRIRPFTSGPSESRLAVHTDGNVTWTMSSMFTVTCNMYVKKFPKDIQECMLVISPSIEDYHTIRLQTSPDYPMKSRFVNSTDWILMNNSISYNSSMYNIGGKMISVSQIMISIEVHRSEETYMIVMITPIVLLTFLIFIPYMLPPQLGPQKVIMPISIFVSYNIFMLMLERIMPKSRYPPAIGYLFVTMMTMCTYVEIMQCFTVKFWNNPCIKPVPKWLIVLYYKYLLPIFAFDCSKRQLPRQESVIPMKNHENRQMSIDSTTIGQGKGLDPDDEDETQMTRRDFWEDMARINDRIGFVITLFFVIIMIIRETFGVFIPPDENRTAYP